MVEEQQEKTSVILGLDPGFKRLGVAVISLDSKLFECCNIKLRPDHKLT